MVVVVVVVVDSLIMVCSVLQTSVLKFVVMLLISRVRVSRLCCQDVLKDMASADVSPNIDTFDSVLYVLAHYKKVTMARTWSMSVLSEIQRCGLGR